MCRPQQAADPDFITDLVMPSLGEDIKKKIMEGQSSFEWGGKTYSLSKVGLGILTPVTSTHKWQNRRGRP